MKSTDGSSRPPPALADSRRAIVATTNLPQEDWNPFWANIHVPKDFKERIYAQALVSLQLKRLNRTGILGVHGLIMFTGEPGTGKSTLAKGLGNTLAEEFGGAYFVEVSAHTLPSDMLGQSQLAVTNFFEKELAAILGDGRLVVVLIDEVEAFAVSRTEASLKANPVDVHRATDAVLEGIDRAASRFPNLLIVATTNFPSGVDEAFSSRADEVFDFQRPDEDCREAMIRDAIAEFGDEWPAIKGLASDDEFKSLAELAEGLTGRDVKKALVRSLTQDLRIARNPDRLTLGEIRTSLRETADRVRGVKR